MAEIVRIEATNLQKEAFNQSIFGNSGLVLPSGTHLVIDEFKLTAHRINQEISKNAVPVFHCSYKNDLTNKVVIYIYAAIKKRYDYQGNLVEIKGTLNLKLRELIGLQGSDAIVELEKYPTTTLEVIERTYKGVAKDGTIRDITYNEYNIIELSAALSGTEKQPTNE